MLYLQESKFVRLFAITTIAIVLLFAITPHSSSSMLFSFFGGDTSVFADAHPFGNFKVGFGLLVVLLVAGFSVFSLLNMFLATYGYNAYDVTTDTKVVSQKNIVYPALPDRQGLIAYIEASDKHDKLKRPTSSDFHNAKKAVNQALAKQ